MLNSRSRLVWMSWLQVDAMTLNRILISHWVLRNWLSLGWCCHGKPQSVSCHYFHASLHCQRQANGKIALLYTRFLLGFDVAFFLAHQASSCLLPLLHVPLMGNCFGDLFFFELFDDMVASFLVANKNFGSHIHLHLFLRDVVNRIPQLSIWLLGLVRVLEINWPFHYHLFEKFWVLHWNLSCVLKFSLVHCLVRLELHLCNRKIEWVKRVI